MVTKKLKLLVSSFMIALGLSAPHHLYAMEMDFMDVEQNVSSFNGMLSEIKGSILYKAFFE